MPTRPRFDDLPVLPGQPKYSAWGLWGDADETGTINLLTTERIAAAQQLAREGKCFPLNWEMELPNPPLFGRETTIHELKPGRTVVHDDDFFGQRQCVQTLQHSGDRRALVIDGNNNRNERRGGRHPQPGGEVGPRFAARWPNRA